MFGATQVPDSCAGNAKFQQSMQSCATVAAEHADLFIDSPQQVTTTVCRSGMTRDQCRSAAMDACSELAVKTHCGAASAVNFFKDSSGEWDLLKIGITAVVGAFIFMKFKGSK